MTAPATVPRGTKPKLEVVPPAPASSLEQIPLELVDVGANVRVDPGELAELAASITELGVLEPVKATLQPDGRYHLVWGQRRVLAARQAGLTTIPAVVVAAGDVDEDGPRRSIEQLVENIQRSDLGPVDEAYALRRILDADPELTQAALAKRLGRSAPWVSNTLEILEAPDEIRDAIARGQLTSSHAKALRGLAPKSQAELAKEAVSRGYSAHRLEEAVQDHKRTEEWRKERETREREESKRRAAGELAAIEKKLGKVDKATRIAVSSYYGNDGRIGHVVDLLKKAGFSNVKAESSSSRAQAVDCDCVGWRVEPQYERLVITPACFNSKHQQAKTKADDDKRRAKYELERLVHERLKESATDHVTFSTEGAKTIHLDPFIARMALWHALGYRAADWAEARGGKRGNPWPTIAALDDETLANALARAIAESFRDNYGYHLPYPEIAEQIGVSIPLPAPKPAKGRKAAAG